VAAVLLVRATDAEHTSPALVGAYSCSYLVGAAISYAVLRRILGGLRTPRLVRFLVRLFIVAAISTAAAVGTAYLLHRIVDEPNLVVAAIWVALITGVDVVLFVGLARLVRLTEVTSVIDTFTRRARVPRRA